MAETDFRGRGWAFPTDVDDRGALKVVEDVEDISRSIELILHTNKGERLMRPDFGSDLHSFVFRPLSDANRSRMATTVKKALMTWEPRIRVLEVKITVSPQDRATALISIDYEIRQSNTHKNLVFPYYLRSAG